MAGRGRAGHHDERARKRSDSVDIGAQDDRGLCRKDVANHAAPIPLIIPRTAAIGQFTL